MKPLLLSFLILFSVLSCIAYTENTPESDLIPPVLSFEGETFRYDPEWSQKPIIKHADFDGNGKEETIIGFQARDAHGVPAAFYLIYSEEKLIRTIRGADYLGEIEIVDVDGDNESEIAFFSGGGAHYTSLDIYKYVNGAFKRIFEKGSACGVELKDDREIPEIWIGREQWDKEGWSYADETELYEVYTWDGNNFVYSEELSTSPLLGGTKYEGQRAKEKT